MNRKLAYTVHVRHPETRETHRLPGGTVAPAWAVPLITNRRAFEGGSTGEDGGEETPPALTTEDGLKKLTVAELEVHATANSINLGGATRKPEIIAAILGAGDTSGG